MTPEDKLQFIETELDKARFLCALNREHEVPLENLIHLTPHRYIELILLEKNCILKGYPSI